MPIDPADLEMTLDNMLNLPGLEGFSDSFKRLLSRNAGMISVGRIIDYVPHTGCYCVATAARANVAAVPLTVGASASAVFGSTDASCYVPGALVLMFYPEQSGVGYIIGSIPPPVERGNKVVPDSIVQAPLVGVADDEINQWVLSKEGSWGVRNHSSSRPTDQLAGDWGSINELGLAILLSKFMAMLRVSDNCGVWAFYFDRLLRLSGYNLEQFTSSTERRIFNDEGEVHDVLFGSKYPWEALGLFSFGEEAFREAKGEWKTGNTDSYYEPEYPSQTGLWRRLRLRGYLGDLERDMVVQPPEMQGRPETYVRRGAPYGNGLLEVTHGTDGRYGVRSAKEIVFAKYVLIPAPKQLAVPDDSMSGDKPDNYKASGLLGAGEAPKPQEEFSWGDEQGDARSGLFLEYLAYTFNWYKVQGVANHKQDWELPEESAAPMAETLTGSLYESDGPGLEALQGSFWAGLPRFGELKIDHRTESVKYYQSMSCFAMLDDGSVVLEDGYGSQIVMSRGNLKLTAPGDVMIAPGRNVVAWAPGDFVARAGRSVDVTATKHDVRLKAERNMHVLGGNSEAEQGGVLIESRSKQRSFKFEDVGEGVVQSGIVLKTPTDVAIWSGKDLHLGIKDLDGSPGRIILDANEGATDVYMNASKVIRDIQALAIDRFGGERSNVFESQASRFGTAELDVRGAIVVTADPEGRTGDIVAEGNIAAMGRLMTREGIPGIIPDGYSRGWEDALLEHSGLVIPAEEDNSMMLVSRTPDVFEDTVSRANEAIETRIEEAGTDIETIDQEVYEADDGLGNMELVRQVGFSLRSDEQYAVGAGFRLHQARWQQIYRKRGIGLVWTETAVKAPGDGVETYPHPGKQAWEEDENLLIDEDQYFDMASGRSNDRAGFEPGAEPKAPQRLSLDEGYLITRALD